MKNSKYDRCPGCGKHCPADAVRCKYGRAYFEKRAARSTSPAEPVRRERKWERRVAQGGLAWQLLSVSQSAKKALRKERITEDELMGRLSADEQRTLADILSKLDGSESAGS